MDSPKLPDIPHIYVDEKKRSKKAFIAIILASILVLSIPIGVYLVQKRTNALPQAAAPNKKLPPQVSIEASLENPKVTLGEEFKADIIIRSDIDEANLVVAKLKFPADSLEVLGIETTSSFIKNWLEENFDNTAGAISLVGGVPTPGFKTDPKGAKFIMATLRLKAKKGNFSELTFDPSSQIFRNSDNSNILKQTKLLTINISESSAPPEASKSSEVKTGQTLKITSPMGGKVYSYLQIIDIEWDPGNLDKIISISLFLNGKNFGRIASNLDPNSGSYKWNPQDTLLLPYISQENSFQIAVTGKTKNGLIVIGFNDGPFGIFTGSDANQLATASATLNQDQADINNDQKVDNKDVSILLSNFGLKPLKNPGSNLNGDGIVNDIDLWLIKKLLLAQGLIKS